jgi:hypothetical protein
MSVSNRKTVLNVHRSHGRFDRFKTAFKQKLSRNVHSNDQELWKPRNVSSQNTVTTWNE